MGLGPGPGSLVARWCSGLARVEKDPANDGLWTPNQEETHRREFESPPGYHSPTSNIPVTELVFEPEIVRG